MIRRSGLAVGAILAAGAFALATALPGMAAPEDPPESGDPRATAFAGNATTCEDAGLDGDIIEVEFEIDEGNIHIDITAVPDDVDVTGTVVKGSPGYNVYGPDDLVDLHAPLVPSDKSIAEISHWYVCGVSSSDSTTSTTSSTTSSETSSDSTVSGTSETTTSSAGGAVGGVGLAETGVEPRGLLIAGTVLLLAGTGLVVALRRNRRPATESASDEE